MSTKQRKYHKVKFNAIGEAVSHEGSIKLTRDKVRTYSISLGVRLMRHLPSNLRVSTVTVTA